MSDSGVRLYDVIYAYIDEGGYGCFSWSPREGAVQYYRADNVDKASEELHTKQLATLDALEQLRATVAAELAERDARIAELEATHRWISVDERLPKRNERVWVIGTGATYPQVAHYRYSAPAGAFWDNGGDLPLRHVTHWMPLPLPPPVTGVTPRAVDTTNQ